VKVVLAIRRALPEGGITLASFRLARALAERGHEAEVLYTAGAPPAGMAALGRRLASEDEQGAAPAPSDLGGQLDRLDPDLVLVGSGRLPDLRAAAATAPTALHAHMHVGACPDNARYWARLRRPCGVRAGWGCAVLRPALGCSSLGRSLDPTHLRVQREVLELLAGGEVGLVCVSSDQAELFRRHGVPASRLAVLPNLGLRADAGALAAASAATPPEWRDATAFFGRLSKAKGGQLLEPLAAALPQSRLRIFGDGYLARRLASLPDGVFCGHVEQQAVLGILLWARAAVFPSLWPEPGGIVGVDAQVTGVPLAAFDVGAARHWPAAELFAPGDVEAMAAWLAGREPRRAPRDPDAVAAAEAAYWERIGARAEAVLADLAAGRPLDSGKTLGHWGEEGGLALAEELIAA
jgi:glycosyltransferase involved in cell wall biosynthesis